MNGAGPKGAGARGKGMTDAQLKDLLVGVGIGRRCLMGFG